MCFCRNYSARPSGVESLQFLSLLPRNLDLPDLPINYAANPIIFENIVTYRPLLTAISFESGAMSTPTKSPTQPF